MVFTMLQPPAQAPASKLVTGAVGICHEIGDRSDLRGIGFPVREKKGVYG